MPLLLNQPKLHFENTLQSKYLLKRKDIKEKSKTSVQREREKEVQISLHQINKFLHPPPKKNNLFHRRII